MNPLVFVVLAAGRGSRLEAETASKPKWLLDVGGETIAARQLSAIADGWRDGDALVVVTGYEADAVGDFLAGRAEPAPRLLHNPHFLDRNNWYSVLIALDEVVKDRPDHSVIILNSDLFAPKEVLTGLVNFARWGDPETAALALDCNRPLSNEAMKVEVTRGAPVRCCAIGKSGVTDASGEYVGLSFVGQGAIGPLRAALRGFESDPSAVNNWYEHGFDVLMKSDAVSFLPWTIPLVDWVEIDDGADLARARQAEPTAMTPEQQRVINIPILLEVGVGAIDRFDELTIRSAIDTRHTLIVTGGKTTAAYADAIRNVLCRRGGAVTIVRDVTGTLREARELAAQCVLEDVSVIVAVGGGRALDVGKLCAFESNRHVVAVPTAISNDGVSSPVASLADAEGVRQSVKARMPTMVIVDTDVVSGGPRRMLQAGVGDLVSNLLAVRDWELADARGRDPYDGYAALISEGAARTILSVDDLDQRRSIEVLAKGLVLSGLAMATAGTSRPCSGAEHLISHSLDRILGEDARLHGEQVGLASLLCARLHGVWEPELRQVYERCGVAGHPSDLGLSHALLKEAILGAPAMRPDRYTILDERPLDEPAVERLLDETFG